MTFIAILAYSLAVFGCAQMFIYFNGPFGIVEKWRQFAHWISDGFGEMFTCVFCFSTNVGWIASLLNYFFIPIAFTPFNIILGHNASWWLVMLLDMFFTCGTTWLWHQLDEYLENNTTREYSDEDVEKRL